MFKHVFCFVLVMGYFFGPFSPKFYNLIDRDVHYRNKCMDFFTEKGPKKQETLWANYRLYVDAEVSLQKSLDKSWKIESLWDIKKDALDVKKQVDELDKMLKEVRERQ